MSEFSIDEYKQIERIAKQGKRYDDLTLDDIEMIMRRWTPIPGSSCEEWVNWVLRRRQNGVCPYD